MSGFDVDNVKNVVVPPPPSRPDFSLAQHTLGARITYELLNGKNFAAWSRSVLLFLGDKGKSGWLLGTITKPNATDPKFVQWEIDNCTILGWFNSMEPRIYHVFMYHDMVPLLWSSLTKMYAHACNETRIFELYREIHQASQTSLSLSMADYFAYLQSQWEELAQYEPLSEFTTEGGIAARRLDQSTIPNQMALAAFGSRFSSGRASSGRAPCLFCGGVTHGRDRCFKLHPELRETFKRNKKKSKASPRTAAISETSYGSPAAPTAPDLHQLQTQFQNQMEQLQSSNLSWVLDSGADHHMTGELSLFTSHLSSIDQFIRIADGSAVHVRSKGKICLSSQLTLSSVLYVPDFAYNLLSDQNSKKIFGRGYEWNGLYYFGNPPDSLPSMSLQASHFWDMAILTATYLLNCTPSRILLDKAPLHLLQPDCTLFPILSCVFGCTCFVQNRSSSRSKLDDKAFRCVFLRYSFLSKGYWCYNPLTSHMHNSFDVTFLEDVPFFAGTPHSLNPRQGEAPEDPSIFSRPVPLFESPQVASPTLPSVLTSNPRHMYSRRPPASDPLPQSSPKSGNISPISSPVLRRYPTRDRRPPDKLGFSNPNATKHSIAQLKWLLSSKIIHGILSLFLGVSKQLGQDYGATFAPVAKLTTVRVIISLATSYSWPLHQLDVKNAFLNGDLHETIYMDPPLGFQAEGEYTGKVCHLRKSLYVLKQSPRAWFSRFSEVVLSLDFIRYQSDHTCFIHRRPNGQCVIIFAYVDDIIITGDDASGIERVKQTLRKAFDTKDLGPLRYFLGIEVARSRRGISLSQRKYVLDLLQDTGMMGCRPASSPMDPNFKLSLESGDLLSDATRYQRLVGRLIYLTHTQPDIFFAVLGYSILFENSVDFLALQMLIMLVLKLIAALLQVSIPSVALTFYLERVRNKQSFLDLLLEPNIEPWPKSVIMLASDSVLHERTKHIEVDVHFIREKVRFEVITPHFVPSSEQATDMFTKSIDPLLLKTSLSKLGLVDIFAPA
ncbi:hypothetical protein Acr_00g0042020 [Actinidia rufa]|uniref:Reverse transcriptase Ty1/copia-type domain-containing protein n=1 Tax=Actinidia rufa TaxID=165716 RepID=A0A7J0DJH9_9ERIC|nr:hypothetical protein Acr_00g0042020 [Actinidia rufa]